MMILNGSGVVKSDAVGFAFIKRSAQRGCFGAVTYLADSEQLPRVEREYWKKELECWPLRVEESRARRAAMFKHWSAA
jgi:hypothetical protein